jgi:hypothetical protein
VAVGKKWYSFFVVTDEPDRAAEVPASAGAGATPAAAVAPARRVSDLVPDSGTEAPAAFAGPVTSPVDLGEVYASAQIPEPAHGYTVLKVAEMLRSEHIRELPADVRRKSVMVALEAAGVKVTDIVEDAVRRDRALDTFERVLQKHLDDVRAETAAENARIEEEINQQLAGLRARIDENIRRMSTEQAEFLAWRARKHQEEATIADAVGYFVSENPITTVAGSAADQGDTDVR